MAPLIDVHAQGGGWNASRTRCGGYPNVFACFARETAALIAAGAYFYLASRENPRQNVSSLISPAFLLSPGGLLGSFAMKFA